MSNRIIRKSAGRINIRHRLVYQVLADIKTVKIIRMWTNYM